MKKIKIVILSTFIVGVMVALGVFVPQGINSGSNLTAQTQQMSKQEELSTSIVSSQASITEVQIANQQTKKYVYSLGLTETTISCPISQSLATTIYAEKEKAEDKKYIEDYCNNYEKVNYVFLNFKISQTKQTIPSNIKLSLTINNKDVQSYLSIFRGTITKKEEIVWNNTLSGVSKKSKTSVAGYDISFPKTILDENGELEFTILLDIQNDYLDSMYISNLQCNISSNISNITVQTQKTEYDIDKTQNTAKIHENLLLKSTVLISENTAYSYKNFELKNIPANTQALNISIKSLNAQVAFVFDELRQNVLFKDVIFFANDFEGFKNNKANIIMPLLNGHDTLRFSLGILYDYNQVVKGQNISTSISVNFCDAEETSQLKYFLEKGKDDTFHYNITGIKDPSITTITIPAYHNNIPVKKINDFAFENNTSITEVIFNKNSQILKMGMSAFENCTGLKDISIPSSVTEIKFGVFYGCKNLKSVSFAFDSRLEKLGGCAFTGCESLQTIIIPNLIKEIKDHTFKGCKSLQTVKYYGTYLSFSKIKIGVVNEYFTNAKLEIYSTYTNHKDNGKYQILNRDEIKIYDPFYLMR